MLRPGWKNRFLSAAGKGFSSKTMAKDTKLNLRDVAVRATEAFKPVLDIYEFRLKDQEVSTQYALVTFEQENRYVVLKIDVHPGGSFFNVLLGEGQAAWPDAEWQAVALWRLIRQQVPASEADVYALPGPQGIEAALAKAAQNLEQYGAKFLSGDLSQLRKLRDEQQQEQQPYRLADKDKKGLLQKLFEQQRQAEQEQEEGEKS